VICNSCRYCEGYCAVFPAMEKRRIFSNEDLSYFANLCHDCRGCYYACQYAPPHEFSINLPQTFAKLRNDTYVEYAWPRTCGKLFERNGTFVSLLIAAGIALVLFLAMRFRPLETTPGGRIGSGAFYAVIPEAAMLAVALATLGFATLALAMSVRHFWLDTGGPGLQLRYLTRAAMDVLTLRNLGGGGHGCNHRDEAHSESRRYAHQLLFFGFLLCLASTSVAGFYEHVLGWLSPYPFLSLPVLLGTVGGVGMLLGAGGLIWVKIKSDPAPAARKLLSNDYALLAQLILAAGTGLLLLFLRDTRLMGVLLALHLGAVLSFFVAIPYSKFVHGIYRSAALVRNAAEREGPKIKN
jgi:citrate/tricarballylate utilization protein